MTDVKEEETKTLSDAQKGKLPDDSGAGTGKNSSKSQGQTFGQQSTDGGAPIAEWKPIVDPNRHTDAQPGDRRIHYSVDSLLSMRNLAIEPPASLREIRIPLRGPERKTHISVQTGVSEAADDMAWVLAGRSDSTHNHSSTPTPLSPSGQSSKPSIMNPPTVDQKALQDQSVPPKSAVPKNQGSNSYMDDLAEIAIPAIVEPSLLNTANTVNMAFGSSSASVVDKIELSQRMEALSITSPPKSISSLSPGTTTGLHGSPQTTVLKSSVPQIRIQTSTATSTSVPSSIQPVVATPSSPRFASGQQPARPITPIQNATRPASANTLGVPGLKGLAASRHAR
ncbi:hypothetical protein B0T16DRAFT_404173 [Cercophora newfieldiana]|uniref:Uncharacterized protein n=1 Tax=Cercophora newfieldiana TaxID=92897 RepID=A0AA40CWA9_9PEZI|nr:hypothetical protein B0T16DRAFT_404173 [Cercophora newfieldiana]